MHKPRQLRIAGYPNVGLTLRAAENNVQISNFECLFKSGKRLLN